MELLSAQAKSYSWGSTTALELAVGPVLKRADPIAELWYGAHASDPSLLHSGERLNDAIASNPVRTLGSEAASRFGGELPFLLKILSAGSPLSLQAHPSKSEARTGFARENRLGIPLDSPTRIYRDGNHKPELLVALGPFEALVGFRDAKETVTLIDEVSLPGIKDVRDSLDARPSADGIKAVLSTILAIPGDAAVPKISAVANRFRDWLQSVGSRHAWSKTAATFVQLSELYPDDPGVLISLMLNRVTLASGEGVFLPAGVLHSYLSGVGVEVMANSDNVLRGGLTTKEVDPVGLIGVLNYEAGPAELIRPTPSIDFPGADSYQQPAEEFALSRVNISDSKVELNQQGPKILVCTTGILRCESASGVAVTVRPGEAVWTPASEETIVLKAATASVECFVASIP